MKCSKCGGEMHLHKSHARQSVGHGGSHAATHGMMRGHPAALVLGLVGMAMSALAKDTYYHQCSRCGHKVY